MRPDARLGTELGGYLIEAILGRGGMGGQLAGEVASAITIETIAAGLKDQVPEGDGLAGLLERANARIVERAAADRTMRGMATTCTLMRVDPQRAVVAHVGDSRAYLHRQGSLRQLTEDHSIVGSMVRERILTPEAAAKHPRRHVVLRALGQRDTVEVDVVEVDLLPGDRLLLCTDGLTSMIGSESISGVLGAAPTPDEAAEQLIVLANDAGGEDNVTAVVVDVGPRPRRGGLAGRLRDWFGEGSTRSGMGTDAS